MRGNVPTRQLQALVQWQANTPNPSTAPDKSSHLARFVAWPLVWQVCLQMGGVRQSQDSGGNLSNTLRVTRRSLSRCPFPGTNPENSLAGGLLSRDAQESEFGAGSF